ncbi:MAG: hypothetical protein RLZZ426_638 [Actinomycetota bacterium]|jgi:hypothetical protein
MPLRTCVGCRRREAVSDLIRLVVLEGLVVLDRNRTLPGRGAHIHPTQECVQLAVTRKALPRAFTETATTTIEGIDEFLSESKQYPRYETRA